MIPGPGARLKRAIFRLEMSLHPPTSVSLLLPAKASQLKKLPGNGVLDDDDIKLLIEKTAVEKPRRRDEKVLGNRC